MQVKGIGKTSDSFAGELAKKLAEKGLPLPEMRLKEQRDEKGYVPPTQTEEANLAASEIANRKGEAPAGTTELQLQEREVKHAPNIKLEGITEQRLNEASSELVPHRNEKAWDRTGDKRPINALPEETKSSDEAKAERQQKADKASQDEPQRLVDKDVGSQLTNGKTTVTKGAGFNLRSTKKAALADRFAGYLEYKAAAGKAEFGEVRQLDEAMVQILEGASGSNRHLTGDEVARIAAIKARKLEILG